MTDWNLAILIWCAINTLAIAIGTAMLISVRSEFATRMRHLDITDQLNAVNARLDRQAIHKDRQLREAVELLIKRLEADPLTRDRHHIDIVALKDKLT